MAFLKLNIYIYIWENIVYGLIGGQLYVKVLIQRVKLGPGRRSQVWRQLMLHRDLVSVIIINNNNIINPKIKATESNPLVWSFYLWVLKLIFIIFKFNFLKEEKVFCASICPKL